LPTEQAPVLVKPANPTAETISANMTLVEAAFGKAAWIKAMLAKRN
jgi:hypothetical protein